MSTTILYRSIAIKCETPDENGNDLFIIVSEAGSSNTWDTWPTNRRSRSWMQDTFCHGFGPNYWLTRDQILANVTACEKEFDGGCYKLVGRRWGSAMADYLRTYKRAMNNAKTFAELKEIGIVFKFQSGPQNNIYTVDSDQSLQDAIKIARNVGHVGSLAHYGFGDRDFEKIIPTKKRNAVKGELKNPVYVAFTWDEAMYLAQQFVVQITSRRLHYNERKQYGKVYEKAYAEKLVQKLENRFAKLTFQIVEK